MEVPFAVTAIIMLAVSVLFLSMARDPKTARLRWMDLLGVMDADTDRGRRKSQEAQVAAVGVMLFCLTIAGSLSCAFWTVDQIRERHREKTRFEREIELTRREIEHAQGKR
jgi:hypothetical protein